MAGLITLERVRDQWQACYPPERLALLYEHPCNIEEVLTRQEGEWASVPLADRFWTVLREELIDAGTLRLFACWCARQCLTPESDKRSWAAVEAGENYVAGKITIQELEATWSAAWSAAQAAAESAQVQQLFNMLKVV